MKVRGGNETIQACKEKVDNAKYGDDPIEINSDDVLKACAVGLGSMGIIYSITYRCVPVYNLEEIRTLYQQTWTSIEDSRSLKPLLKCIETKRTENTSRFL